MKDYLYKNMQAYFPSLANQVVKVCTRGPLELLVKLEDGSVYLYDDGHNTIRKLPSDPSKLTEEECKKELAKSLYDTMYRKGLTQEELSEKTGISQTSLSRYMTGKVSPSFYIVDKIAKALGCSMDNFRYTFPDSEW